MTLKEKMITICRKKRNTSKDKEVFLIFRDRLNSGEIRAAEKIHGKWQTNNWVKEGILLGFRLGKIVQMGNFRDKDTYPTRDIKTLKNIRVVPIGSAIREGSYIGKDVIMMPPMYINVGAYIGDGTMIDSHALVGTCAQIGKNVHISAASQIGGVLEPIGADPVIIEDDVFIGGNCGIYEGVLIGSKSIVAAGVTITAGTPVYDAVNGKYLPKEKGKAVKIPQNSVIVSGCRTLKSNPDFSVYCPIIVKYRDEKSDLSVILETDLR